MKKEFIVPFMVLHRDDLAFMDKPSKNISDSLTNDQMQQIANKLGKWLAEDWDELIGDIKTAYPEMFEVKK